MSIKNKEQISIHLKSFRNLSSYTVGRFYLRIHIYTFIGKKKYFALPINLIQKNISQTQNQAHTQDNYYLTKSFPLKSGCNAQIDQICIFRFDVQIQIQQSDYTQIQSKLVVQLIHCDFNSSKIVGQYKGSTKGIISDVLIIDFHENCPGQLVGSIHTCILNYQFIKQNRQQDKHKNNFQYIQEIFKYLQDKSQRNYKKTLENIKEISTENKYDKNKNIFNVQEKNKNIDFKYSSNKNIEYKEDNKTTRKSFESQQNLDKNSKQQIELQEHINKRKRKPIFQSNLPAQKKISGLKKSFKIPMFEKKLHQYSMKIYQLWRQLNELLLKEEGDFFILIKKKKYIQKLKNKIGQSVIRFKGLKDLDAYSDSKEVQRRNLMIQQLRNQPKQFQQNQFSILNQSYFTPLRPIFFQQSVGTQIQLNQAEKPLDYMLIVLVHGLGACRIDMQKLKVELKRYYQQKIKIYVSTSNESRTQGDIDGMGMRLATQVESEVNKSKGSFKICIIGHSMGGLIIRSALPRLQKFKQKFYSFITFSSPHIGYAYSNSKLIDAGLWFINTMKKCISIEQMTMTDKPSTQECFLFKLSQQPGLQWFKKITFLASHQDSYVPFYSARIQKSQQIQTDLKKGFSRSLSYCKMIDNILNRINGKIIRLDVDFCIPEQNLDNLIGRAAHISFINNVQMLRTFCIVQENSIF